MSGRYIDADDLIRRMYHEAFEVDSDMQKWDSGCWIRYKVFENCIAATPTADVVEVVRCKDCKYRKFIDWGMGDCLHPKGSKHIAYDYHYCSYGERVEDDKIH